MSKIKSVAIANRGEVACRIILACQEMGIESVLLHSVADIKSRAYRMADKCVCIGDSEVSASYLNIANNINGAKSAGAEAIHPGFGFLSENGEFARKCVEAGLVFIGPNAETIELLGDKIKSKELAQSCGIQMVPGYQGDDQSCENLSKQAEKIGYPVIVKAAAGGGGRGMKVIESKEMAVERIESAQREALSSFGSEKVFLEKYLNRAKHIEIQIFSDGKTVHHLFDRECSVQRRHQKIIEEACSGSIDSALRDKITAAAVKIIKAANYLNAGTVEFLLQDDEFYFLEVNTRLQVEHPVTEMVLGIDLVKAQIKAAAGEPVGFESLTPRGHSIECRIYAEDPVNGMPSTGKLGHITWPSGLHRRFEFGFESGDEITSFYDSMIAKVVVWDESREGAIAKMISTLSGCIVLGVKTNISYLREILQHPEFTDSTMNTQFISKYFDQGLPAVERGSAQIEVAELCWKMISENSVANESPFQSYWRNFPQSENTSKSNLVGTIAAKVTDAGAPVKIQIQSQGKSFEVLAQKISGVCWVHMFGETFSWKPDIYFGQSDSEQDGDNMLVAPMPGKIVKILAEVDQDVKKGHLILVMEAMKMEYTIAASVDGKIVSINCAEGDQVELGQTLALVEGD